MKNTISMLEIATNSNDSSVLQVTELLNRLLVGNKDDPAELGYAVAAAGVSTLDKSNCTKRITEALEATEPVAREGALNACKGLITSVGKSAEPYYLPLLPAVLGCMGDKTPSVRQAAAAVTATLATSINPHAVTLIMPMLYEAMSHKAWQTKEAALLLLKKLVETAPEQASASG